MKSDTAVTLEVMAAFLVFQIVLAAVGIGIAWLLGFDCNRVDALLTLVLIAVTDVGVLWAVESTVKAGQ